MEIELTTQKKVPLLGRTEVEARITFSGATPGKDDVAQKIAQKFKADVSLVEIKKISMMYGHSAAKASALVYEDKGQLEAWKPKLGKKAKEKLAKQAEEKAKKPEPESQKPAQKAKEEKGESGAAEAGKEEKAEEKKAEAAGEGKKGE